MNTNTKKRIEALDIAKGFGILMVLYAHSILDNPIMAYLQLCAMQLFFILSGIVIKNNASSIKKIFLDESKLLKIYIIWSIVYIIFHHIMIGTIEQITSEAYQTIVLWGIEVLWFITTLMLAKIFLRLLMRFIPNPYFQITIVMGLFLLTSFISPKLIALSQTTDLNLIHLFYLLGAFFRIFIAAPFIFIGIYFKQFIQKILELNRVIAFFVGALCTIIAYISTFYLGNIDFHFLHFGKNYIVTLFFSLVASLGIILLSHAISRIIVLKQLLTFSGRNSLVLMLIHLPFLDILKRLMKTHTVLNNITPIQIFIIILFSTHIVAFLYVMIKKCFYIIKKKVTTL